MAIAQTFSRLSLRLMTDESQSELLGGEILRSDDGKYRTVGVTEMSLTLLSETAVESTTADFCCRSRGPHPRRSKAIIGPIDALNPDGSSKARRRGRSIGSASDLLQS